MTTHTFVGNLTADPEFRPASDARASVHLRIACSERYYSIKAREWRSKDPTFWDAYAWGDRAEAVAAAAFRKGNPIVLVGELVANSWMNQGRHVTARRSRLRLLATTSRSRAARALPPRPRRHRLNGLKPRTPSPTARTFRA